MAQARRHPFTIYLLIAASGFAALSWEVIWQLKAAIALGVSAWGAALTIAVVMGGMSAGSLLMGKRLGGGTHNVLAIYGKLEIVIGMFGLLLGTAFSMLEQLDHWVYAYVPSAIGIFYLLGITMVFVVPALCMGATLPVFAQLSRQYQFSLTKLYWINTFGAAMSVLLAAFLLIPALGVHQTILLIASVNLATGIYLLLASRREKFLCAAQSGQINQVSRRSMWLMGMTGFAIFVLEIAWFRAFSDIFSNTTDSFALLLACVLIALAWASKCVSGLKVRQASLSMRLCAAGILILLITPVIEHIDYILMYQKQLLSTQALQTHTVDPMSWLLNVETGQINRLGSVFYAALMMERFIVLALLIIPPIFYLGMVLPWLLDEAGNTRQAGWLYAINTTAAMTGSLMAAWLLLPTMGVVKTAWFAGLCITAAGLFIALDVKRWLFAAGVAAAFAVAFHFETGIGSTRILGYFGTDEAGHRAKLLRFSEGPDVTTAVLEYQDGARALVINNTAAAWESGKAYRPSAHYMAWSRVATPHYWRAAL